MQEVHNSGAFHQSCSVGDRSADQAMVKFDARHNPRPFASLQHELHSRWTHRTQPVHIDVNVTKLVEHLQVFQLLECKGRQTAPADLPSGIGCAIDDNHLGGMTAAQLKRTC